MEGIAHGLAGAGASVAAITIVYPLEKVSKEMQNEVEDGKNKKSIMGTLKRINAEGGAAGFYQGIESSLLAMACSMYAFFWSHNTVKTFLLNATGQKELNAVLDLIAGYASGVGTAVLTEPIWMINTRLMLQKRGKVGDDHYEGVVDCAQKVYKRSGIYGFFKGLPGALGTVLNSAIQLMVYEQLRKIVLKTADSVGPGAAFVLGAVSKMIATFVTYPLQTVGTRMQNQKAKKKDDDATTQPEYKGTIDCAQKMLVNEGVGSFFGGLKPRLLQMVLQNAFKFMFYERIVEVILTLLLGKTVKK